MNMKKNMISFQVSSMALMSLFRLRLLTTGYGESLLLMLMVPMRLILRFVSTTYLNNYLIMANTKR